MAAEEVRLEVTLEGKDAGAAAVIQHGSEELKRLNEEAESTTQGLAKVEDQAKKAGEAIKTQGASSGEGDDGLAGLKAMFEETEAAVAGAQERVSALVEETSSVNDLLGDTGSVLDQIRSGIGGQPELAGILEQATGLAGILDTIAPAIALATNPVVIAAAASAGAFWLIYENTVVAAMDELAEKRGTERENIERQVERGGTFWLGQERLRPELARDYTPSDLATAVEAFLDKRGPLPAGAARLISATPEEQATWQRIQREQGTEAAKRWGREEWGPIAERRAALELLREREGEQAFTWAALVSPDTHPGSRAASVEARAQDEASRRMAERLAKVQQTVVEFRAQQLLQQDTRWGAGVHSEARMLAEQTGVSGFPVYSDEELKQQEQEAKKAEKEAEKARREAEQEKKRIQRLLGRLDDYETRVRTAEVKAWFDQTEPYMRPADRPLLQAEQERALAQVRGDSTQSELAGIQRDLSKAGIDTTRADDLMLRQEALNVANPVSIPWFNYAQDAFGQGFHGPRLGGGRLPLRPTEAGREIRLRVDLKNGVGWVSTQMEDEANLPKF